MKKIIILVFAASVLLFTGCFIDSDTATVRINLGNIPVAKVVNKSLIDRFLMIFAKEAVAQVPGNVEKVHIAALGDGSVYEKITLELEQLTKNEIIEMEVPAGSNRTIIIAAEYTGYVTYYGTQVLSLSPGEVRNVQVEMFDATWSIEGPRILNGVPISATDVRIEWDGPNVDGIEYVIEHGIEVEPYFIPVYRGSGNSCTGENINGGSSADFRFKQVFVPFGNLSTNWSLISIDML